MELNRRDLIRWGAAAIASRRAWGATDNLDVNDVHAQLNRTRVARIERPDSIEELRTAILGARDQGLAISVSGSRHSMGGQQFGTGMVLIDTRGLNRVRGLDSASRIIEAEAGIEWPELLQELSSRQAGQESQLGIFQKQTGADRLSLGGALSSNVHGRGLNLKPFISNVESFEIMRADGEVVHADRQQTPELFRLAIGGYGLFGVIVSVRLRLRPRVKVRRVVRIAAIGEIHDAFEQRIQDGYLYGDFQFATDNSRDSFLRRGVFSCYQPVDPATPLTENPTRFHPEDWARLTYYSHTHKKRAFDFYTRRYLATSGQVYYHDWQLSAAYQPNYHAELDRRMHNKSGATEMITELYVPRPALEGFMEAASTELRQRKANVIYGTVRLIEKDDESFLAWARDRYACVIFNLHVIHTPENVSKAADAFRALIDLAMERGGSYYLTYHRWATRRQVETCYPNFREFLEQKHKHDPGQLFQSDWYVAMKNLLA